MRITASCDRLQKVVVSRELELAAQLYFPGGRYLTVFIFFAAWSASSGVISTVIRDCTAPLALTANDLVSDFQVAPFCPRLLLSRRAGSAIGQKLDGERDSGAHNG
jgi:hypothetical protein